MTINRNLGLDCLRSLAIAIVLANHGFFEFFLFTGRMQFGGYVASLSVSAVIAIEWLFVLSGYLIGTMMIRSFERPGSWARRARDFWLRRWFRTVPNYYLFVLVNLLLLHYGLSHGVFEYEYLYFSQNLASIEAKPHFFGESWSLALDEWFYLSMPILLGLLGLVMPAGGRRSFVWASTVLIVLPMAARAAHVIPLDFFQWDDQIRRITLYHLDATGWGVLAAVINKWYPGWWYAGTRRKLWAGLACMAGGLFFVVSLVHPLWMNTFWFGFGNLLSITLMSGGTFLVLPWLTGLRERSRVIGWITTRLGLYSYSIYLVHYPMLYVVKYLFPVTVATPLTLVWLEVGAWLVSVLGLSALLFHGFEKPVSDLRDYFTRRVDASPFQDARPSTSTPGPQRIIPQAAAGLEPRADAGVQGGSPSGLGVTRR